MSFTTLKGYMNLYTISINGRVVDWAGTQLEAKQRTKELSVDLILQKAKNGILPGEIHSWEEHEVPTDKPGLLAWLKVNALGEKKAATRATSSLPLSALPPALQPKSFFHGQKSPFSKKYDE